MLLPISIWRGEAFSRADVCLKELRSGWCRPSLKGIICESDRVTSWKQNEHSMAADVRFAAQATEGTMRATIERAYHNDQEMSFEDFVFSSPVQVGALP